MNKYFSFLIWTNQSAVASMQFIFKLNSHSQIISFAIYFHYHHATKDVFIFLYLITNIIHIKLLYMKSETLFRTTRFETSTSFHCLFVLVLRALFYRQHFIHDVMFINYKLLQTILWIQFNLYVNHYCWKLWIFRKRSYNCEQFAIIAVQLKTRNVLNVYRYSR